MPRLADLQLGLGVLFRRRLVMALRAARLPGRLQGRLGLGLVYRGLVNARLGDLSAPLCGPVRYPGRPARRGARARPGPRRGPPAGVPLRTGFPGRPPGLASARRTRCLRSVHRARAGRARARFVLVSSPASVSARAASFLRRSSSASVTGLSPRRPRPGGTPRVRGLLGLELSPESRVHGRRLARLSRGRGHLGVRDRDPLGQAARAELALGRLGLGSLPGVGLGPLPARRVGYGQAR